VLELIRSVLQVMGSTFINGASQKSGQISIQIFRYTVPPPEIVIDVQESLMLLVNSHILKMAAMLKPSAEYNRRAAIIEDLRAGRSATEIIRFFGYPRSTVYDVVVKYTALKQSNEGSSMPARKSHSKERTARIPAVIERAQTLISDDPRQSLRKLASIVGVSEPTMRRIAEEDLRYKSYTLKRLSEAATTKNCSICPNFGDALCITEWRVKTVTLGRVPYALGGKVLPDNTPGVISSSLEGRLSLPYLYSHRHSLFNTELDTLGWEFFMHHDAQGYNSVDPLELLNSDLQIIKKLQQNLETRIEHVGSKSD
ncbi:hypothetical protein G5I_08738, partial [Acromyrmex echinatior]